MPRLYPSIFLSASLLTALIFPGRAAAQSCCAVSTSLAPTRLGDKEKALIGLQWKAETLLGSMNRESEFIHPSPGTSEINLEQHLFAAFSAFPQTQFAFAIPFVEAYRSTPENRDFGGGIGDLGLEARYDILSEPPSSSVPRVAALGSVVLPTGRAPEESRNPLAVDATGQGDARGSLGLEVEKEFESLVVNAAGRGTLHSARSVLGNDVQRGFEGAASVALGYIFSPHAVLGLGVSYSAEASATFNGESVENSGRANLRASILGGIPLGAGCRMHGTIASDIPIPGLVSNQPVHLGFGLALFRVY